MPEVPLGIVTDYLRRVSSPGDEDADAVLLARYVRDGQADAFALLVQRHGPMVLGVCRRALGPSPDADDAFQATFLALARNAARVHNNLSGWLYCVAVRACRKALRRAAPAPAAETADPADPFATVEWQDVRRVLDAELSQLPEKWRTPLILCHLTGLTRDEAAARLGWSLRTLHRRLDEGRQALRRRLGRRGLGPVVLATAILAPDALQAHVPARLVRDTAALGTQGAVVSESIRALVPRVNSIGGWTMKAVVSALFVVGGTVVVLSTRQPAGAVPVPIVPLPPAEFVRAPAKNAKPPEDELTKKVREAQKKGIDYLKSQQKDQGGGKWNWENDTLTVLQPGGSSALAMLALLESGVKLDDEVVARGLKYLRTLEPKHTYVVGLQTQVFCKANQKEDADLIKRNVRWLEDAAVRRGDKLEGWSYTANSGNRADNSNTRYAIAGLYAAYKVGFKPTKTDFWKDVRDYYLRNQTRTGGWTYANGPAGAPTHTMTCSGTVCLLWAKDALGKGDKEIDQAIERAFGWISQRLTFSNPPHTFYNCDVIADLGRSAERANFGTKDAKRLWYREGCEFLTGVKPSNGLAQKAGGEWLINQAVDSFPVISTSFALRFLASRPD